MKSLILEKDCCDNPWKQDCREALSITHYDYPPDIRLENVYDSMTKTLDRLRFISKELNGIILRTRLLLSKRRSNSSMITKMNKLITRWSRL